MNSMQEYLRDKNYLALYLNSIGVQFSSALVLSFVGAHLFTQGLPLYLVLLYFGLEFLFRALFTLLSHTLTQKYGIKHTIVFSNIVLILYFFMLSLFATHPVVGFCSFILYAFSRGIYHPAKHYL